MDYYSFYGVRLNLLNNVPGTSNLYNDFYSLKNSFSNINLASNRLYVPDYFLTPIMLLTFMYYDRNIDISQHQILHALRNYRATMEKYKEFILTYFTTKKKLTEIINFWCKPKATLLTELRTKRDVLLRQRPRPNTEIANIGKSIDTVDSIIRKWDFQEIGNINTAYISENGYILDQDYMPSARLTPAVRQRLVATRALRRGYQNFPRQSKYSPYIRFNQDIWPNQQMLGGRSIKLGYTQELFYHIMSGANRQAYLNNPPTGNDELIRFFQPYSSNIFVYTNLFALLQRCLISNLNLLKSIIFNNDKFSEFYLSSEFMQRYMNGGNMSSKSTILFHNTIERSLDINFLENNQYISQIMVLNLFNVNAYYKLKLDLRTNIAGLGPIVYNPSMSIVTLTPQETANTAIVVPAFFELTQAHLLNYLRKAYGTKDISADDPRLLAICLKASNLVNLQRSIDQDNYSSGSIEKTFLTNWKNADQDNYELMNSIIKKNIKFVLRLFLNNRRKLKVEQTEYPIEGVEPNTGIRFEYPEIVNKKLVYRPNRQNAAVNQLPFLLPALTNNFINLSVIIYLLGEFSLEQGKKHFQSEQNQMQCAVRLNTIQRQMGKLFNYPIADRLSGPMNPALLIQRGKTLKAQSGGNKNSNKTYKRIIHK